jgi:two-component system C4-dicarboxylate transport response regulator DctD
MLGDAMKMTRNSKPAILIVDDSQDYAEMISAIISETFTRQTFTANDAHSALSIVDDVQTRGEFSIDAVISDIHMPGMSGHDFLKQLVSKGVYAPVIFVSGLSEVNLAIQAIRLSAFDYLTKPIKPEQLTEATRLATLKGQRLQEIACCLEELHQKNNASAATLSQKNEINHLIDEVQKNWRMAYLLGLKNSNAAGE